MPSAANCTTTGPCNGTSKPTSGPAFALRFCGSGGNSSPRGYRDGSGEAGVAGGDGGGPVGGYGGHMAVVDGAPVGGRVGGRPVLGGAAVGDDAVTTIDNNNESDEQ